MRIKEMRERAAITQKELADRMGVAQPVVCKWESGTISPTAAKIPTLARVLGCEINDLFDAEK